MLCRKQKNLFTNALSRQLQAGQILLIAILVIIVALTIGLSLASRSIISLKSSTEEAESQKALAAAEAGIERAIQGNSPVNISTVYLGNNSNYSAQVIPGDSHNILINGGNMIPKDEGADVWVVAHDSNNNPTYTSGLFLPASLPNVNVHWGSTSENCTTNLPAAIEIIVVSRNSSTDIKSYRYVYDPCYSLRGNHFSSADSVNYSIAGKNFTYRTSASNPLASGINNIVFMRVIPIYKNSVIGVSSPIKSLPAQGYLISSTGTSGQANRKLTVFKGYPQTYLPYLSYGLFVAN